MSDHCGSTTEDGNAVCIPGECTCSSGANNNQPVILSWPTTNDNKMAVEFKKAIAIIHPLEKSYVAENS